MCFGTAGGKECKVKMIFLKKLFKHNDSDIVAVVNGTMIPPLHIKDHVFQSEMMGQTIGFVPLSDTIVSPVNGTVSMVFPTKHAVGIQGNNGISFIVHIGIDTVNLNGKGLTLFVKKGDHVKAGQKLIDADMNYIKMQGLDSTVILIASEFPEGLDRIDYIECTEVKEGQIINQ